MKTPRIEEFTLLDCNGSKVSSIQYIKAPSCAQGRVSQGRACSAAATTKPGASQTENNKDVILQVHFTGRERGRGPLHTALSSGALVEPVFTANRWAVPPQPLGTVILWSHQTPAGRKGQGAVLEMCGEQWLSRAKRSYNLPERKGKSHKNGLAWNSSPTLEARKHWNDAWKFLKEAFSIILH